IPMLRGDLDWIVMKALEKDRARRYESAAGFAADIARHLNCEPVTASPPSALYRARKMARRHKLAIATAGGVARALVISSIVSTLSFFKESEARHRAESAEQTQLILRQRAEREATNARQMQRFIKTALDDLAASVAVTQDKQVLEEALANGVRRVRHE